MSQTTIITGHYGSGKTEFCLNLALRLAGAGSPVCIADLDVINPYFRSREREAVLKKYSIEIAGKALESANQDLPALSYGFVSKIGNTPLIIDLAGGENGLKLLANCYGRIKSANNYEFLCVFNAYRPETATAEKMIDFVNRINAMSKLPISGLVNNGNMLHYTTKEHVLHSQNEIIAACEKLGLPLRYTLLKNDIFEQVHDKLLSDEAIVFDKLQMREAWQ
jgi:hypothetical protein